jgi:hypothetical protein
VPWNPLRHRFAPSKSQLEGFTKATELNSLKGVQGGIRSKNGEKNVDVMDECGALLLGRVRLRLIAVKAGSRITTSFGGSEHNSGAKQHKFPTVLSDRKSHRELVPVSGQVVSS